MMNNEQQHTHGPWRATINSNREWGVRTTSGFICFLPKPNHYHEQDERYKRDLITNEANARIIAAAPELLEALEKLARLGNGDRLGNSEGNMIARAAIAKAIGRQTTGYTNSELNCPGCMGPCGQCYIKPINNSTK